MNIPCEYLESYYPLRIERWETVPDTGGAGLHRGGNGVDVAYRFLEAGTRVVQVNWPKVANSDRHSWDCHKDLEKRMREDAAPMFDPAFATLIEDLDQRGMLEETLVVCVGEFGMDPGDLIFDTLTFTLATGQDEFRRSAVEMRFFRLIAAALLRASQRQKRRRRRTEERWIPPATSANACGSGTALGGNPRLAAAMFSGIPFRSCQLNASIPRSAASTSPS